jgi:hypothetical protein
MMLRFFKLLVLVLASGLIAGDEIDFDLGGLGDLFSFDLAEDVDTAYTEFTNCYGEESEAAFSKCDACMADNTDWTDSASSSCDVVKDASCKAYETCSTECLSQQKCGKELEKYILTYTYFWGLNTHCTYGCTEEYSFSKGSKSSISASADSPVFVAGPFLIVATALAMWSW